MTKEKFIQALDEASARELTEPKRRGHLGASALGAKCVRQVWYGFRWAREATFDGRMHRLFNRGHEEEFRVVRWLRAMDGVQVRDYAQRLGWHEETDTYVCMDWDIDLPKYEKGHCIDVHTSRWHIERATALGVGPKQYGFVDHKGHHAGSGDGQVLGLDEWFPEIAGLGWGLLECKTSNEKSFNDLVRNGVFKSKVVHYVQMQTYMKQLGLKWALYIAVNKNTDYFHPEIVKYRPEIADYYNDRALGIISTNQMPPRCSNDPSWFECKFCDYRMICHYDMPMEQNCRSCAYSKPVDDGQWHCHKFHNDIPNDFIPKGCPKWEEVGS